MTRGGRQCAICGGTQAVLHDDPAQGPVCLRCWMLLEEDPGDEERKQRKREGEEKDEGLPR